MVVAVLTVLALVKGIRAYVSPPPFHFLLMFNHRTAHCATLTTPGVYGCLRPRTRLTGNAAMQIGVNVHLNAIVFCIYLLSLALISIATVERTLQNSVVCFHVSEA